LRDPVCGGSECACGVVGLPDPARFTERRSGRSVRASLRAGRPLAGVRERLQSGTAAIEASSGPKARHRLNPRGNRQLNHALHIAAITQIAHDTPGRAYYDRKIAEGKTRKEALRALKRRISNAVYRQLITDTRP